MNKIIDYHAHTQNSFDSDAPMVDMCSRAIRQGITEIGFTDHFEPDSMDHGYNYFDYNDYCRNIQLSRERFENSLKIKMGVEITFHQSCSDMIKNWLNNHEFDFVMGSIHLTGGVMYCSGTSVTPIFQKTTFPDAYLPYFYEMKNAVKSGLFDTIGHFDLPKKFGAKFYGNFDIKPLFEIVEEILLAAIHTETAIEINTSGYRHIVDEPYPHIDILRLYKKLGGKLLTIGSDGHNVEQLGLKLQAGYQLAKAAGFDRIVTFNRREKEFIQI